MEAADYRKLLTESRSSGKPLGCGVGLSKDGKTALFLIHKTHPGLEVSKALKAEHPDIVNLRFGNASVEKDEPTTVRLELNRPVTGIAKKLVKTLKGSGFKKVKLVLEDGTALEDGADEEEPPAAAAPATGQEGAPAASSSPDAPPPPPPPPPPPHAEAPAADAAALKQRLASLAQQIPAASAGDAARQAALAKLAREAQVNLGTNNLGYARIALDQLEKQLAAPPSAGPDFAALKAELTALGGPLKQAIATDPARQAALVQQMTQCRDLIEARDPKAAEALTEMKAALGASAPGSGAQPTPPPDGDKLSAFLHRLLLLIPNAAGDNDALRAEWMALAEQAGAQLGASDLAAAAVTIEKLRAALEPFLAKMKGAKAKDPKDFVTLGKTWLEKRQHVEDELERLRLAIAGAFEGHQSATEIDQAFRKVTAPVLQTFNASLAVALNNASKETDEAKRAPSLDAARDALGRYNAFLQDKLLAELDDNPFAPLALRTDLSKTLSVFAQALR